jgi:hypothetical protein
MSSEVPLELQQPDVPRCRTATAGSRHRPARQTHPAHDRTRPADPSRLADRVTRSAPAHRVSLGRGPRRRRLRLVGSERSARPDIATPRPWSLVTLRRGGDSADSAEPSRRCRCPSRGPPDRQQGRRCANHRRSDQRLSRPALELLAGEELEGGPVELFGVFVQAGVGEMLEDH